MSGASRPAASDGVPRGDDAATELLKAQRATAMPHLRQAVLLPLLSGGLVVVQAWLIALVVDGIAFRGRPLIDMVWPLVLLVCIAAARAALTVAAEHAAQRAGNAVKRALRARLVEHVERAGPVALAGEPTGRLVSALTDSVQAIAPYFARYVPAATLAVVLPVAIVLVVLPLDWVSALVMLVTAPLIPVFMILIGGGTEALNQRQWSKLARMSGHFLDAVQGLATLKTFNAAGREADRVARTADDYRRATMRVLRLAFLSSLALEFFATVSIAMIAVLVGFRLLWGQMPFFNGFLVLLLAPELYQPLRALGAAYHARLDAIGAARRLADVLALPVLATGGSETLDAARGIAISFEDVSVVHADGRAALDRLSFTVAAGERIHLVGASGSGKTTVLALLLGFLAPTSGRILVNGRPLADLDVARWRSHIAYLRQRPHMFEASIAANIAMSLDGGAIDIDRVRAAARRAGADDLVASFPAGYDTPAGEHGAGLSGGEAQRIALARAFYRDAPLVLVDEPAAHLDRDSEATIARALRVLAAGRTSIEVAHRLGGLRGSGRIIVLDAGRLAESGSHDDLVAAGGIYASLTAAGSTTTGTRAAAGAAP